MTSTLRPHLLIVFTFICLAVSAQDAKKYIIPFQLTPYNNLSIEAVLNKQDTVQLMFHTASNALHITEDAIKKLKSIRFDRTDSVKSWGGDGNSSRYSKNNSLQIGDLHWEPIALWEDKYSGHFTDGKFGPNLFQNKVIEIDFDKKLIIISTDLPAKTKKYEKLKLIFERDNMFIESSITIGNSAFKNKFLIHSGYGGAILLDDQFANENKIGEKLKIIKETTMKDAFGNDLKTQNVLLPVLKIGNEKLEQVPAGFWKGAIGRQKMSAMGGDILKRFNIIIDAQREYIYLKANHLKRGSYLKV
jgi:hypothetical protein